MENITCIGHQAYLFKGTVRANLLIANPDKNDAELWKTLEQVELAGFLKSERGLDTLLSEAGTNFSGGQRQRLALARALLHDSPLYIFDEATSSIDVESENLILNQIESLAQSKTVLLIAHRLMNTRHADTIYVMSQGQIVEQGTHQTLVDQMGYYQKLWYTQHQLEHWEQECHVS
jgi:ABC-type multidrug transport system fused ATPase/permease subunit